MRVHRGLPTSARAPVALTIGTFDGVHRGHRAMLNRLVEAADDLGLPSAVLTFDPHPREFFAPASAPARLSTLRDKLEQIAARGVEHAFVVRFDARLAALTPQRFVDDILIDRLAARWVLVGDDFRFGKARGGGVELLRTSPAFSVEVMHTVEVDGERVSSSAVREALAGGRMQEAAHLLGRPFTIGGRIAHGRKLGRTLGVPTANLPLRRPPPVSGIFAARVHGLGAPRAAVASIGVRPTVVEAGAPLLEAFIFDFDDTIYGKRIQVELVQKLRDEERYPDLDTLKRQIGLDIAHARAVLADA